MSAADMRRRLIQQTILRDLLTRFEAIPDLPICWADLLYGFSTSICPYTEDEVRSAMADLVERRLAESVSLPSAGELPERAYRITDRGRDFYRARCPWEKLNEFLT